MLKARDIMTKNVLTVTPDTEITQAAKLLLENHFNGLPVVDESGKLIGILCQDDLIVQQKRLPLPSLFTFFDGLIPLTSYRSLEKEVEKIVATTVSQAMTTDPITIDAARELARRDIGAYWRSVVRHYELVGDHLTNMRGYEAYRTIQERVSQPGGVDQMVDFCWKYLAPLAFLQLVINLVVKGLV